MFNSRTALVEHLVSAEHRRLTVLCPWCHGKTRTFTKVSDLEVHMKTGHPDISVPKDRFSRPNGFYFSIYPADYAKIVECITAYDSDAAYEVRKAVRTWAERFPDKIERMEIWNDGWKEGARIASERKKSREQSVHKTVVESTKYSGGTGETPDRERGRRDQAKKTQDKSVERIGSPIKRKRDLGETAGNEQSRLSKDRVNDEFDTYVDDIELGEGNEQECQITGHEGQESRYGERYQKVRRVETVRPEAVSTDNERQVEEVRDRHGDSGFDEAGDRQRQVAADVQEQGAEARHMGRGGFGNSKRDQARAEGEEIFETTCNGTDSVRETGETVLDRREIRELNRPAVIQRAESEDGSSTSSSASSTCSSPDMSGVHGEGMRARAYRLLSRGAMPVCPPARRDWSSVKTLDIECRGQALSWPPNNRRSLTPDQKLMAHEHAAMLLEKRNVGDFPQIFRKALLDKYAFFALEGEGKPQDEGSDEDKVDGKIRQYNFTYIKGLVKGEIGESRMSWSILRSLEQADRWTYTDVVINKLDSGGIKEKI